MQKTSRYQLSFTALSLGLSESIKVIDVYLKTRNWGDTKEILNQENLLQSRTFARNKRITQELIKRLSLLSDDQLAIFPDCSLDEQRLLLWFAVCNQYLFIREFAIEVLHENFLAMNPVITEDDFRAFYFRKSDMHPELEKITENTRNKLRTQLFRMLREAGLLTKDNAIIQILPTSRLTRALKTSSDFSFKIYPAFPQDFEELK